MAILRGMVKKMKGSAGELVFRGNSGRTIVSEKPASVKNIRSAAQQHVRMKWGNIIQMYKVISPLINYGFENKPQGVTDYNMFVKLNMQSCAVYLSRAEVANGGCIAAPYKLSQGSLNAIETSGKGVNTKTDIALGSLAITDSTTVGEFSIAVVSNNDGYEKGDNIVFFSFLQKVNGNTGIPYVRGFATRATLDTKSQVPLWTLVSKAGFASKDGVLAHGEDEGNGVFCWVHTRKRDDGLLVSTQSLVDNNPLLSDYMSDDAYRTAVNTYGGENEIFLAPSNTNTASGVSIDTNPSSGGGSSQQGGGSEGGF